MKTGILKCAFFVGRSKWEILQIMSYIKILARLYNEILIFGTFILLLVLTELLISGVQDGTKTVCICPDLKKNKGGFDIHSFWSLLPTTLSVAKLMRLVYIS